MEIAGFYTLRRHVDWFWWPKMKNFFFYLQRGLWALDNNFLELKTLHDYSFVIRWQSLFDESKHTMHSFWTVTISEFRRYLSISPLFYFLHPDTKVQVERCEQRELRRHWQWRPLDGNREISHLSHLWTKCE